MDEVRSDVWTASRQTSLPRLATTPPNPPAPSVSSTPLLPSTIILQDTRAGPMTFEDILSNLFPASRQTAADPGRGRGPLPPPFSAQGNLDTQLDRLLRAFESECQSWVRNEGASVADHFTGLLCTILAAEILVCYCATMSAGEQNGSLDRRRGYRKCLSSLYSEGTIGFIVCNPSEVTHLAFSWRG